MTGGTGPRRVYFDHAATAGWRPPSVIDAVVHALRDAAANPGRSGHRLSLEAARLVEGARLELAEFLGAPDPSHLVFTKNATEAANLVLHGFLEEGDGVVAGPWEHNAVLRPLRELERRRRVRVEILPPGRGTAGLPEGIDLTVLRARLRTGGIRLAALSAASNVTGEIFPIEEAAEICRAAGVFLLVDAAQAAGVAPLDLSRLPADALVLTGHKSLYGPPGVGALYLAEPERVAPLIQGGTGSRSEEETQPEFPPDRFEAGTPNLPGLAGLAAGVRHVRSTGLETIRERHRTLRCRLRETLRRVDGVAVLGPDAPAGSLAVVPFAAGGAPADLVARGLDRRGILCRPGLHCSPRAHRTLGTHPAGTVRFALSIENTVEEIEVAAAALRETLAAIRG